MRFRYVKQGKTIKNESKKEKRSFSFANNIQRAKAFITDSFLLAMPLFYLVIYLVFDGLRGESGVETHRLLAWIYILIPLSIIYALFLTKSGQTPGMKAYDLKVIDDDTLQNPSFFKAFMRFIAFNIAFFSVIGLLVGVFRKDHKGLADLLSKSSIIEINKS
jgi:uncharacterized RDD family membrane protein YckC